MSARDVRDETIHVTVKPGSRKGPLVEVGDDGSLLLHVREPASDGKANAAARALLARHLDVPRSCVTLTGGATSRHKRFRVLQDG